MPADTQAGKFQLDFARYELRLDGRRIRLERQPMELLIFLVQKQHQLVTREDIVGKLWGNDVFVDVDGSINSAARKIRSALGDDPAHPRYLETVVGKGYRFIGNVEVVGAPPAQPQGPVHIHGAEAVVSRSRWRVFSSLVWFAALLVLSAASALLWLRWRQPTAPQAKISSLAVLPLVNLSGDPSQDYFADGMTDELITKLAGIRSLRVISRTSVIRYQGTRKTLPQIANELRVDAIVEGTVVRSGDKLRVTAQLLEAKTDRHLWAESFERDFRDVLSLQREIAGAITEQVNATLTPTEHIQLSHMTTANSQAYDAYLRGRFFWNKWTEDGVRKGIQLFPASNRGRFQLRSRLRRPGRVVYFLGRPWNRRAFTA